MCEVSPAFPGTENIPRAQLVACPPSGRITQWKPQLGLSFLNSFPCLFSISPCDFLGGSLPPFVLPEPPACPLSGHSTLVILTPYTMQLHCEHHQSQGSILSLFALHLYAQRGLNQCLLSDIRMNNKGTFRGKLSRKGPLKSPDPLSYLMPCALCWTPLVMGSHCHLRHSVPFPWGLSGFQRRDSWWRHFSGQFQVCGQYSADSLEAWQGEKEMAPLLQPGEP